MISAPIPINEQERLADLYRYSILETPFEQSFDELVQLASKMCQTPMALITIIDKERQWFKAVVGVGVRETPREIAFCSHTILEKDILEISDTLKDERFLDNPLVVREPLIRFYAGVPLTTEAGFNCGTLCVLDIKPRSLTNDQKFALKVLAKRIVQQMEFDKKEGQLKEIESLFGRHYINVLDSINFGEKIQEKLLFQQSDVQDKFPESFVSFKQKAIISNTFCFLHEHEGQIYLAQFDCRKEGFVGLFLGSAVQEALNNIIVNKKIRGVSAILSQLRIDLGHNIQQSEVVRQWALSIALCSVDKKAGVLAFCGAGKSLFMISDKQKVKRIAGDKKPFDGKPSSLTEMNMAEVKIQIQPGISFYLCSDGVFEQSGQEGKYGNDRLMKLLERIVVFPMKVQGSVILEVLDNWKGSFQQENDILCVGFKL